MRLTQEQISAVQQAVRKYIEKANLTYNRTFSIPVVRFDLRGVRGGVAHMSENVIRINPVLLVENFDVYIKQTVGHEVAHLITHQLYNHNQRVQPHGREWQLVMTSLGLEPSRCHSYDVSNARARNVERFEYSCNCMVHQIGKTQHKKMSFGTAAYSCKKCNGALKRGTQIGGSTIMQRPQKLRFSTHKSVASRFGF
jgi:SprT protein